MVIPTGEVIVRNKCELSKEIVASAHRTIRYLHTRGANSHQRTSRVVNDEHSCSSGMLIMREQIKCRGGELGGKQKNHYGRLKTNLDIDSFVAEAAQPTLHKRDGAP
jgi:hypothetical protein